MYNYYLVHSKFRNEAYSFVVKIKQNLGLTDKDVHKIVCNKFQTTIAPAEISYNKKLISEVEYSISNADKQVMPDVSLRLV